MATADLTISSQSNLPSAVKMYEGVIISLENCLLPPEKLSPTPSMLDGVDLDVETDLRILGCELIQDAGILLRLPQVAMASGQVLFQRFFFSKSFVKQSMETVSMACICLASKIEESPRRIRDVCNVFNHIKQIKNNKPVVSLVLNQDYISLKNQVIKAERRILKELGFCVHVKHPHKTIVTMLQLLEASDHKQLMQKSWNYMNDSLRTDVFVRYAPETIACACIYLSARELNYPLPTKPAWYLLFDAKESEIKDISRTFLGLYQRQKADPEKLDQTVTDLKSLQQEAKLKMKIIENTTPVNQGFSPGSRTASPKNGTNNSDSKETKTDELVQNGTSPKADKTGDSPHKAETKDRSSSRGSSKEKKRSRSPSPYKQSKKYDRSPPVRGYKEHRHHRHHKSRSRSREKKESRHHKLDKKRRRSRSLSVSPISKKNKEYRRKSRSPRSYSRSPVRTEKAYRVSRKERSRNHGRSRSHDRSRR